MSDTPVVLYRLNPPSEAVRHRLLPSRPGPWAELTTPDCPARAIAPLTRYLSIKTRRRFVRQAQARDVSLPKTGELLQACAAKRATRIGPWSRTAESRSSEAPHGKAASRSRKKA